MATGDVLTSLLQSAFTSFEDLRENLVQFLSCDTKHSSELLSVLRVIFEYNKKDESLCGRRISMCPFETLQLDSDNEIIWQQIQLQNEALLRNFRREFKHLLKKEISFELTDVSRCERNDENLTFQNLTNVEEKTIYNEDFMAEETTDDDEMAICKAAKSQGSIVDDQFFKLAEMESFSEGKNGNISDDSENIDCFFSKEEVTSSDFERNMMYSDYFDAPDGPTRKKDKNINMKKAEDNQMKSSLEQQQDKMKKQIAALEDSNVEKKSWQLMGESSASARPANSLLEEVLQFDHISTFAPVITEETSQKLEDIITQRIKDQAWDDVERKEKTAKETFEYKKAQPVNQEKSKMSLSEIYEKEYLKQQNPETEKQNEEHIEIKKLMKSLFFKLDSLSNFHFTPKPLKSEVTILSNVPSISLEECAPVTVSDTALLAPEEIYDKKVEVKSAGEKTSEDKKRERRVKKRRQRLAAKAKLSKERKGLGKKHSKLRAMDALKKDKSNMIVNDKSRDRFLNSSSGFFTKLQDSVTAEIHAKSLGARKEKKVLTSSTHLKL